MAGFELTAKMERYLGTLSKLYAQEGNRQLQELIVNSKTYLHERWNEYDADDGTYFGHALYLQVPEVVYLNAATNSDTIREKIKNDLNEIHHSRYEFIDVVFIEMDDPQNEDWRVESGLLLSRSRVIAPEVAQQIWGSDTYRVFLSHKSSAKTETAKLKGQLAMFGISAFVAHEDIHPTKAWQDEIENALSSMDAFVALMTSDFHDSDWTDQEVGYAFARSVPIIAVNVGRVPYGFIGKFQALKADWDNAPLEIVKLLIKYDRMVGAYVHALSKCVSFDAGNTLAKILPNIERLTVVQIDEIIKIYNGNSQLQGSYGFNGKKPNSHDPGLVYHLKRLDTSGRFETDRAGQIKVVR